MNPTARCWVLAPLLLLALVESASAGDPTDSPLPPECGQVLGGLPEEIERDGRYLFYLHGAIIEQQGVRPVSPRFGTYEYEAILDSLAAGGLTVISEARSPQTNVLPYAEGVVAQIDTLLAAGVPPEHVSVVGFSKGGAIAMAVSSLLGSDRVSFVFLASCLQWVPEWQDLNLRGRILVIYERSDFLTDPCRDVLRSMDKQITYEELEIQVGGGHGAFYRPARQWLDPVLAWITHPGGVGRQGKSDHKEAD